MSRSSQTSSGVDFETWVKFKAKAQSTKRTTKREDTSVMYERCDRLAEARTASVVESKVRIAVREAARKRLPANPELKRHAYTLPPLEFQ